MDQAVSLHVAIYSDLGYSSPEFIAISVSRIERLHCRNMLERKAGPKTNSVDYQTNQQLCDQTEFATNIRVAVQPRVSEWS